MAEQQALLERPIEAAAHSDSGNVTHTHTHTHTQRHTHTHTHTLLNPLSNVMLNYSADE